MQSRAFHVSFQQKVKKQERAMWEKVCIGYATGKQDPGVKDFFMKQLQLIGGAESAEAVKAYLGNRELCDPALGVITAVGGPASEKILGRITEEARSCHVQPRL